MTGLTLMICSFFEGVDLAIIKHMINRVQKRSAAVLNCGYKLDLRGIQVRVAKEFRTGEDAVKRTSKFIWNGQYYSTETSYTAYVRYCL